MVNLLRNPDSELASEARPLALLHGRTLVLDTQLDSGSQTLQIRSAAGELELAIELTQSGARLRVRAVDVDIEAAETLRMSCARAELNARESIELRAQHSIAIVSERGGASLQANDDVSVKGERILLNADARPMSTSLEAFRASVLGAAASPEDPE